MPLDDFGRHDVVIVEYPLLRQNRNTAITLVTQMPTVAKIGFRGFSHPRRHWRGRKRDTADMKQHCPEAVRLRRYRIERVAPRIEVDRRLGERLLDLIEVPIVHVGPAKLP